jgi:hypothetical protein
MQNYQEASPFRVGIFIDGFTFRKVNEYYRIHDSHHSPIDFMGLKHLDWSRGHKDIQAAGNDSNGITLLSSL